MYSVKLTNSPVVRVSSAKHEISYAIDGSMMNPLETFYATLAACAAVFAKKACRNMGCVDDGIEISAKPFAGPGGPYTLGRFTTTVRFPDTFAEEQKANVIAAIENCAIKLIVENGAEVNFTIAEG